MADKKLEDAYYQGDHFWTVTKAISEVHKIKCRKKTSIRVSKTSTLGKFMYYLPP